MLILVLPPLVGDGVDSDPILSHRDVEPLVIDVDSASWYEWALLDGIGEIRARRIVEYVRARRPITSLDELKTVPGLPTAWVARAAFSRSAQRRVEEDDGARE